MDKARICEVKESREIAEGIARISFVYGADGGEITPGRFVHILPPCRPDMLLRRPFGIHGYNADTGVMDIVCQVVGEGSAAIASAKAGDMLDVFGPAGNGFPQPQGSVWLVGGGIGCSPLDFLPAYYPDVRFTAVYGFRSVAHVFGQEEMQAACAEYVLLTDDGSAGRKGFATEHIRERLRGGERPDAIMACGPMVMLRGLRDVLAAEGADVPCYVSLEQRMGCGMGACYTCTCDTQKGGTKGNARVCMEGPVFDIREVAFDG